MRKSTARFRPLGGLSGLSAGLFIRISSALEGSQRAFDLFVFRSHSAFLEKLQGWSQRKSFRCSTSSSYGGRFE